MRLLLDTHIWLWSVLEPERLGACVRHVLSDPGHELWISPISIWEVLLLCGKGRFHIPGDAIAWTERAAAHLREAPLTNAIARQAHQLPLPHRDPADRFLAATAYVLDLTLVTADVHLLGLPEIRTMANR